MVYRAFRGFIFNNKKGDNTMKKLIGFGATAVACALGVWLYQKYLNKKNEQ